MGCSNEKERPQQIAYQRDFLGACWDSPEADEATAYRPSRWLGVSKQVMQRATRHHCFLIRAYRVVDDKSPAERVGERVRALEGSFATVNTNYSYAGSADLSLQRTWLGPNSPRPAQSISAGYLSPNSNNYYNNNNNNTNTAAGHNGSFSMGSPSMYSRTHPLPPPSQHQAASVHSAGGGERHKRHARNSRLWTGGLRRGETIQQQVRDTNYLERLMHNQHAYLRVNGLSVHQGVIFRAAPARRHYSHIALLLGNEHGLQPTTCRAESAKRQKDGNSKASGGGGGDDGNDDEGTRPPLVNSYAIEDYDVPALRASTPPVIVGSISPHELLALSTNAEVCLGGWLYVSLEDERKRLRHALNGYLARYVQLQEQERKEEADELAAAAAGRRNHINNNNSSEPIAQSPDVSPGRPSPSQARSRDGTNGGGGAANNEDNTPIAATAANANNNNNNGVHHRRQRSISRLNRRHKEMVAWLPSGYLVIALPMYECAILPTAYHLEMNGCRPISLNLQDAQSRRSFGTGCITGVRYGGVILLECRDRVTLRELQWVRSLVALYEPRRCGAVPARGPVLAPMPYNLWSLKRSIVRELANEGMYVVVAHTRPQTNRQTRQAQAQAQVGSSDACAAEPIHEADGPGNVLPQASSGAYEMGMNENGGSGPHSPFASRGSDDSGITAGAVGPEENEVRGIFRQLGGMKCMDAGRLRYGCAASYVALNVVKWLRSLLQWPIKARPLSIFLQRYEGMANVLLESSMELSVKGQLGNAAATTLGGSFANYNMNSFVLQQGSPTYSAATMTMPMDGHSNMNNGRLVYNANAAGVAPAAAPRAATLGNSFASPLDAYPGSSPNVNSNHDNNNNFGAPGGGDVIVTNRNRLAAAGVIFPFNTYYTGPLEPDLRALLSPAVEKLIALQHQPARSPLTPGHPPQTLATTIGGGGQVKKLSPPQVPVVATRRSSAKADSLMPLVLKTDSANHSNSGPTLLTTPIAATAAAGAAGAAGSLRLLPRVGSAATLDRGKSTTLNLFTLNSMVNNQAYMDVDVLPAGSPTANAEMVDSFAHVQPTPPSFGAASARQPTQLQLRLQQVASFARAGGFVPRLLAPQPAPAAPQPELTAEWYETDRELRGLKADLEEIQFLLTNARTEWLRLESEFYRLGALFLPHTRVDSFVLAPLFIKALRQFPEDVPAKELHADWLPALLALVTIPHAHLFCHTHHSIGSSSRGGRGDDVQAGREGNTADNNDSDESGSGGDAFAGRPYTHFVSAEELKDTALCQALTESLETNYYISQPCPPFARPQLLHDLTLATPPPHISAERVTANTAAGNEATAGGSASMGGFGGGAMVATVLNASAGRTVREECAEGQLSFRFTGGSLGVLAGFFYYYADALQARYEQEAAWLQRRLTRCGTEAAMQDVMRDFRCSGDLLRREHNVFLRRLWIWGAAQGTHRSSVMRHTLRAMMQSVRRRANNEECEEGEDEEEENGRRNGEGEEPSSSVLHEALEGDEAARSEAAASGAAASHSARRHSHTSRTHNPHTSRHQSRRHRRRHVLRPFAMCTRTVAVKLSAALEGSEAVQRERLQRSGIPFRSSEAFALFDAIAHYLRGYETLQHRFLETFGHLLPATAGATTHTNLLVSSFDLCVNADHFYKQSLQPITAHAAGQEQEAAGAAQWAAAGGGGGGGGVSWDCTGKAAATAATLGSSQAMDKTTSAGEGSTSRQGQNNNNNNNFCGAAGSDLYRPRASRFGARKPTGNHIRDRKLPIDPQAAEQPYCGGEEVRQKWSVKESRRLYSFLRDSLQRWRGRHSLEAGTFVSGKHITVTMV